MNSTKDDRILTLNSINIIGKKVDIDIAKIDQIPMLEELILKNITIDSKLEEKMKTLKQLNRLFLINCTIQNMTINKPINSVDCVNCKELNNSLGTSKIFEDIQSLTIENCDEIDINNLLDYNLQYLQIRNTKIINFDKILKLKKLRGISLNEIKSVSPINYKSLPQLEYINLDGSSFDMLPAGNIEKYIHELKHNYKFSMREEFHKIG